MKGVAATMLVPCGPSHGTVLLHLPDILRSRAFWQLAGMLLLLDFLTIGTYVAAGGLVWLDVLPAVPVELRVDAAWGVGNVLTYGKWLLCVVFLLLAWRAVRQPVLLGLAAIFLAILLDDSLQLHERLGTTLALAWELPEAWGLRPDDLGELVVWALFGGSCLVVFLAGYRASAAAWRRTGEVFLLGFLALAACGIALDMLHVMTFPLAAAGEAGRVLKFAVGLAEDGGEMIVASLITAYAHALHRSLPEREANGEIQVSY